MILLVHEYKKFQFQPQVDVEKALQLGEDDLICSVLTFEIVDMSNLGVPFKTTHEIHFSILQHLIQVCLWLRSLVVSIQASTSMLGLLFATLKFECRVSNSYY